MAVGQLAGADRFRDLRQRGLVTDTSTPAEIDAVEYRLAAQMRGRIELEGNAPSRAPYKTVIVITAIGLLIVLGSGLAIAALPFLVACAVGVVVVYRREQRRTETLSRAAIVKGHCGWCGQTATHEVDRVQAHPRVFHAVEIEGEIGP